MSFNFKNEIEQLDKNKTYFVYCRSGNRSGQACMMMSDLSLKAYNLIGGIGAWPNN
jgi:rhodanese-related sulfurtransferase